MKKIIGCFLFLLFSAMSGLANAWAFYKDANYVNLLFTSDDYQVPAGSGIAPYLAKSHNDEVSSIAGSGCLIVFENHETKGRWALIRMSQDRLQPVHNFFNDGISSFIVFEPTLSGINYVCPHASLHQYDIKHSISEGGDVYPLTPNRIILNLKSVAFNDKISSISVPDRHCLKAWVDAPTNATINNPALYQSWLDRPDLSFGPGWHDLPKKFNDEITAVSLTPCFSTFPPNFPGQN